LKVGAVLDSRVHNLISIKAMGHTVSDETKHKKAWDSNAITPGTPFMDLLATALAYWVTKKVNTDPGWKDVRNNYFFIFSCFSTQLYIATSYRFGCQRTW
jgi:5'-3' exonuclease